jgi:type II secretory pathway component PulC
MAKSRKILLTSSVSGLRERAISAVRPGVEALLLAAVALGCAQAGWSVLTPSTAGAFNATNESDTDALRVDVSEVVSPFAPNYTSNDAQSHAVAALLSGVQLSGVRVSTEPLRSGAVLTMSDGAQRAFSVGDDIGAGVTLSDVGATYVLVSYQGGQQEISMTTAPGYSFARAMMGLEPAPGAPQLAEAASEQVTPAAPAAAPAAAVAAAPQEAVLAATSVFATSAAAPEAQAQGMDWLRATLAQPVEGQNAGWRLAEPLPQAALDAGLRSGDTVVSVNGATSADALTALSSPPQSLALSVMRDGQLVTLTIDLSDQT